MEKTSEEIFKDRIRLREFIADASLCSTGALHKFETEEYYFAMIYLGTLIEDAENLKRMIKEEYYEKQK